MKYLLDTARLESIEHFVEYYPISGVSSNPSIVKKEGRIDFFSHMRRIREIIGRERMFHVQVSAQDFEGMLRDADAILEGIDSEVYVKIPANETGFKAMKSLKGQGVHVTATAVYSAAQGLLAMECGADYLAPYFNRMENLGTDPEEEIRLMAAMAKRDGYPTRVLAASFKNMGQVNRALRAGAEAVTIDPEVFAKGVALAAVKEAVDTFDQDWNSNFGAITIADMK